MQKDLLAELQSPKLNSVKSLEDILTDRLPSHPKENSKYLNKIKLTSEYSKVTMKSVMSDFSATKYPSHALKENIKENLKIKGRKRNVVFKKSMTPFSFSLKSVQTTVVTAYSVKGNSVYALNRNQKNSIQDNSFMEIEPSSTINFSGLGTHTLNTDSISSLNSGSDSLKDVNSFCSSPEVKPDIQFSLGKKRNKCLNGNSSPTEKFSSSLRNRTKCSYESFNELEDSVTQLEDLEGKLELPFCVISEVVGNAQDLFCDSVESQEEPKEIQPITLKKTNDITKIKGWRRKQFFLEKPATVGFAKINKRSVTSNEKAAEKDNNDKNSDKSKNVRSAFVCDSLDEFLDQEAELKIDYEIPHLYAEFGIKLTSDEIVSKPNISEKDKKDVETRYCLPVPLPNDVINLDDEKEEPTKRVKRPIKDDVKPSKALKFEENKRCSARRKVANKMKTQSETPVDDLKSDDLDLKGLNQSSEKLNNIKLMIKLIALVVYPGAFAPLHPLVQYHLKKIRNGETKVDKNWANFAASAVLENNTCRKRFFVPAYCCVKTVTTASETKDENVKPVSEKVDVSSNVEDGKDTDEIGKEIQLKKFSIIVEKFNSSEAPFPWCMEHNCYNCEHCGFAKTELMEYNSPESPSIKLIEEMEVIENDKPRDTGIASPQANFDKQVANLLAKKIRLLKSSNSDTLPSIDCLKTLTPNTIEFIKLKFVKESFLTGYVNIWYLKGESPVARSRAFLSFTQTPPMPNAINLNPSAVSYNNLPKVIMEIVSVEKTFDVNEHAILHCDGEVWEIHGSLNITLGKSDRKIEQIFTSAELPELRKLQEIAFNILQVKAVKWWVLDLTQKFALILIKSGNFNTVVSRKRFTEAVSSNLLRFLPLRRDSENRVLGAYSNRQLMPFVLIGPYYLLESHNLVLKSKLATIPFMYYSKENVTTEHPLKFFINSVIKNLEKCEKKLEGLWLYDKICVDNTSYLEVVTTNMECSLKKKYSSIDIEHGYSLNSLTNFTPLGTAPGILKRGVGTEGLKNLTVYLYFDIFELGYVEGELQCDNSVIIRCPLNRKMIMKSHKIGHWFLRMINKRIHFIPENLPIKWFVTKYKEDLRARRPFNKVFLGGAHVLTKNGLYCLLELSNLKIKKLKLDKNEITKALRRCEVVQEMRTLKSLSDLLVKDSSISLSMLDVLREAYYEIKKLKRIQKSLKDTKTAVQKRKQNLLSWFLNILNSNQFRIPFSLTVKMKKK